MTMSPRLIYRWIAFLLAGGYCLRMLFFGGWEHFGGPFRFLTVWALFAAFWSFSRLMALEEGRSERRWDGFISMAAVLGTMVVILYWRLYFADPASVTRDGELGRWYLELYLHGLGPALLLIDALFIHRSFHRIGAALGWLFGVITLYLLWAELVLEPLNTSPSGTLTSGLPYPFLNSLEFADRAVFYATNFAVAVVLLLFYAGLAWGIRRQFPVRAVP